MTRPLTKTELTAFGRELGELQKKLKTTSPAILELLRDALDHGYPTRASTVPAQPTNEVDENGDPVQPSTQPEAAVVNPDRTARAASDLIDTFRDLHRKTVTLAALIEAWDPNRAVRHCPRCGHPYEDDQTRCQQIIDGRQCGAREDAERYCTGYPTADACPLKGAPVPRGKKRRDGLCDTCRSRRHRDTAIGTMTRIHQGADIASGGGDQ